MTLQKAVFVTHHQHIGDGKGGVQRCTAEYLETLEAMGLEVQIVRIRNDQRLDTKILRRLNSSPYFRPVASTDLEHVLAAARKADIVFLNQVALCAVASQLKAVIGPSIPIIALSHGCEITDLLHVARLNRQLPLSARLRPTRKQALAQVFCDEVDARAHIDGVISLSDYDAQTETWLGSAASTWVPRTVKPDALDWSPVVGRFGFVGTLDHAPSLEGLVQVLDECQRQGADELEVHIVGNPPKLGEWLVQRYRHVKYLGALNDADMQREASTWSAFLNPIFCQARGCSTKLAMALGWQIPILTTTIGRRGYVWEQGGVVEANTSAEYVTTMRQLAQDSEKLLCLREGVIQAATTAASMTAIAAAMESFCEKVAAGR